MLGLSLDSERIFLDVLDSIDRQPALPLLGNFPRSWKIGGHLGILGRKLDSGKNLEKLSWEMEKPWEIILENWKFSENP